MAWFWRVDYAIMAVGSSIGLLLFGRIIAGMRRRRISTALAYMANNQDGSERRRIFG